MLKRQRNFLELMVLQNALSLISLRVCVFISSTHAESLVFEASSARENSQEDIPNNIQFVAEVSASTIMLDDRIDAFQLTPKDIM